jgi:nucleotide-binding universal stress UspA family protein
MRRYMVVANQTLGSDELLHFVRDRAAAGPSEFWLVVPATPVEHLAAGSVPMPPMPVMGGVLSLPGDPEEARRLADEKLQAALKRLRAAGAKADGEVGDGDPIRAIQAALRQREFDEIVVSTLPQRLSRWLRQDLPRRIQHKVQVPVTHVEAAEPPARRAR